MKKSESPQELSDRIRLLEQQNADLIRQVEKLEESSDSIPMEKDKKYHTIWDQAPVGIATIESHSGRFAEINCAYCNIVGYSKSEMLDMDFMQITHPDDLQEDLNNMERLRSGEIDSFRMEKRYICKHGETIWVSLKVAPLWEDDSEPKFHIAIVTDISELKLKESHLIENELKMQNLVNNFPGTAYQFLVDSEGVFSFLYMGSNCIDLFGYTADEILADSGLVFNQIPQPDIDVVQEAIKESAALLTPYKVEHRVLKKNGGTIWVYASSIPRKLDDGGVVWDGIGLNITEKKQLEEKFRAEKRKFKAYFENLPTLAYNISFDGIIIDVNNLVLKTLGYSEKTELIGKALIPTIYAPASHDKAKGLFEKWKVEKVLKNEELQIITKEGETIDVLLNSDTIVDPNGTPIYSLSTHLVVSELKKIHIMLHKSEGRLRQAHKIAKLGYWDWEMATGELFWSNEVFNIFGQDENNFHPTAEAFEACIHPDDYQDFLNERESALEEHRSIDIEHRIILPDGNIRYVKELAEIIRDKNGNVAKVSGTVQDVTELKLTNKELIESEKKYQQLTDTMLETLSVIDLNGNFLYANKNATRNLSGEKTGNIIGKNIKDLLPFEQANQLIDEYNKVYQSGETFFQEILVKLSKGDTWFSNTLKPIDFGISETQAVLSVSLDIDKRKKAEESLAEAEKRWRNILVNTPQIGISLDTEARIIFANEHFLRLTGWREEEIIGKDWFEYFIPKEINNEVRNVFLTTMKQKSTEGLSTFVNEIITKNGESRTISWSNVLTMNSDGTPEDVTCLGIDLTERVLAENALKDSEAKYRSMMDSMHEAAYICSSDYQIEYMNPAMIKKVGRSAIGELCHEVIHNSPKICQWCEHHKVMNGEVIRTEIVTPGDDKAYFVSHSPIHQSDGSISKLTIYRDVTEIKKLETRLQQSQKMESIGTLAGGIAHDFNNILFPIVGQAEMLMQDFSQESPEFESAQEILKAGKRGSDLVKQILSFSRKSEQKMIPVRMQNILAEVVKLTRSTIPADIEITHHIQNDCRRIMAEPTQLHQVFMNLITNAYHAVELNGGRIHIELNETEEKPFRVTSSYPDSQLQEYALFQVKDTGVGIPSEIINKVFDPYFTTKEKGKGTGLGLATAYGIIKEFNGEIRVFSKLNKGTTFKVYLPLIEHEENVDLEKESKLSFSGTERILVVDDEEAIAKLETKMLERSGYTVTQRTSSIDALEKFKATPNEFDLVVTDMAMPNMSGDILADKILKIRPDIPIIICTGFSERMNRQRAETLGLKGFLHKPVVMSELTHLIRKLLDGDKK